VLISLLFCGQPHAHPSTVRLDELFSSHRKPLLYAFLVYANHYEEIKCLILIAFGLCGHLLDAVGKEKFSSYCYFDWKILFSLRSLENYWVIDQQELCFG
jgi:hypothetical protein